MKIRFYFPVVLFALLVASCTKTVEATDPASVIKGLFNAVNKGNAQLAASYFADDAEITSPWATPSGMDKIKGWFSNTVVALKTKCKVQELKVDGDNLTGTFKITVSDLKDTPFKVIAVVHDRKIKSMTWTGQMN